MLRGLRTRLVLLLCGALHLEREDDVRKRAEKVAQTWGEELRARNVRIDELAGEVARLQATRVSDAVEEADCPRCAAPAGERCHDADGRPARRTHRERTAAWRASRPTDAPSVEQLTSMDGPEMMPVEGEEVAP